MARYILKRLLAMIPTLLGVAVLIFLLLRVVPGDVVEARYLTQGSQFQSQELMNLERAKLGLDQPLWKQFTTWMTGIARLDFGVSMWTDAPITEEIKLRFALSLQVALMASTIATLLAIPLGILAAVKQDTWVDYAVRVFSIAGLATPSFWLGILMILVMLTVFKWIPPMVFTPFWVDPWENLAQLIWPALAVGYRYSAVGTRMMRSAMLEVLREDYIRTARAKGLWLKLILARHALKNAILPVLTIISLEFAFLLGGLVVTEQVFNLNGLGMLFVEAIARRDYTLTQALVMLVATVFLLVNFFVDIAYAWLDPAHPLPLVSVTPQTIEDLAHAGEPRGGWRVAVGDFVRQRPLGAIGAAIVLVMVFLAATAGFLAPYDPLETDYGAMLAAPDAKHWLGTDAFGRDVLSRIIYGSRTALMVGLGASLLGATFGSLIGVASAYFGGRIDLVVQRVMDVFFAFPVIILALAVVAVLGTGAGNVILAIALPMVPRCARVVRASALAVREMPYVDAARAAGYGNRRIILRHMLPNVMAPILIMATAFLGEAILLEASLSFLGLGVQEPVAAWGLMLRGAAVQFAESAPWMAIFPGLAISLAVFGFNLFGDSLRDALDPRLRTQ